MAFASFFMIILYGHLTHTKELLAYLKDVLSICMDHRASHMLSEYNFIKTIESVGHDFTSNGNYPNALNTLSSMTGSCQKHPSINAFVASTADNVLGLKSY